MSNPLWDHFSTIEINLRLAMYLRATFFLVLLAWSGFLLASPSATPEVTDRARLINIDRHAPQGFHYVFVQSIDYSPSVNMYTVGLHCYRGKAVRFDVPVERFVFQIGGKTYSPPHGAGGSVWHRFMVGHRLNFLLSWIDASRDVVELPQDACADVVLDTRYGPDQKLISAKGQNVSVQVFDENNKALGRFDLKMPNGR